MLGLCSGAHTAFHAGLEIEDAAIGEIVMINPMQFHWVEGMSLDTSRRFEDMLNTAGPCASRDAGSSCFGGT